MEELRRLEEVPSPENLTIMAHEFLAVVAHSEDRLKALSKTRSLKFVKT